jgi:hypothetical protein
LRFLRRLGGEEADVRLGEVVQEQLERQGEEEGRAGTVGSCE